MNNDPPHDSTFRLVVYEGEEGDGWWGIEVRELDCVFSQVHHVFEAVEIARNAIAMHFDVPEDEVGPIVIDELIAAGKSFVPAEVEAAVA